jgi:hypothetical protein
MTRNTNKLVKTIERSIGYKARFIFKLGNLEEDLESEILGVTESGNMVIINHPEPFLNFSIMEEHIHNGKRELLPKLVKQMCIPINNILAFKVL